MLNFIRALCAILFFAALAACGGGGGGGSAAAPTNTPAPEFALGSPEAVANVAGQVSRAAQTAPRAGSATQSSGANDAINVAVRAHSNDGIVAVVGGATLAAAHRPDVDNVRVWLANNNAGGKLATLGISLNPACPGETDFEINDRDYTGICRRHAESPVLTAPNHADGGFAVIATTGQMPVIIDGRTAAINYRTATITSSQFRSANMFSRTDDGGLLYSRVYSDAVLSPSAPRTVSFYEVGVVTIHNANGTLVLQNEEVHHSVRTLHFNSEYYSPNAPSLTLNSVGDGQEIRTTIASPAPGNTANIPVTLGKVERIVSTTLTGPRNGDNYRRNYLSGGFWMHAPANAESIADYEFGVFSGGSDELSAMMIPPLAGVAVYRGEAAGVYASSRSGQESVLSFRANAALTADFSSAQLGARVEGRVDGFVLANGTTLPGAINLGAAERANTNTGLFSGDTGGELFDGKWGGNFYGAPRDDEVAQPDAIAATFGGTSSDRLDSIAGFIGARRVSAVAVGASFAAYPAPPLRVDAADVWQGREVDNGGGFFALYDGADKLRAAGFRFGALEVSHRRNQPPSALSDGGGVLPFFAADDGMHARYDFGGGLSGFAAQGGDYRQIGFSFRRALSKRITAQYSLSRIDEDGALLGSRWGGLLRGGESKQARAKLTFAPNENWTWFAAAEQSAIQAKTGDGIIGRIDGLRAFGWRAGVAAKNIGRYGDSFRLAFVRETAITGGTALLHLQTPMHIIKSALPLASDKKHRTIAAGYGFASSPETKWSIAAAHRIGDKTSAHIQWQMELE